VANRHALAAKRMLFIASQIETVSKVFEQFSNKISSEAVSERGLPYRTGKCYLSRLIYQKNNYLFELQKERWRKKDVKENSKIETRNAHVIVSM
jgi:alpha-tubulin suppressor-like RCC1 family protein